jgi:hypothetical protein
MRSYLLKFSLFLFLFLSSLAYGFDKDFITINDKVPHEFNLLFDSMKIEIKTPSEKVKMIGICKDLNDNLGSLQKEHIFILMKTEVIKSTLEFKFSKIRQFDVNESLITRLEEDFKSKKAYLNSFSSWIWQSILAELNYRKKMGLITLTTFNANLFQGAKRLEAQRFERYLIYLTPWIDKMDSLDPVAFNALSKEVSWKILERINARSLLFKRFASTATSEVKTTIINIPQKLLELEPQDIKEMQKDVLPTTLEEQSKIEKVEALKEIEKTTPVDLSPLSEDVSKELEKVTEPNP